jgi:hypothetical protein
MKDDFFAFGCVQKPDAGATMPRGVRTTKGPVGSSDTRLPRLETLPSCCRRRIPTVVAVGSRYTSHTSSRRRLSECGLFVKVDFTCVRRITSRTTFRPMHKRPAASDHSEPPLPGATTMGPKKAPLVHPVAAIDPDLFPSFPRPLTPPLKSAWSGRSRDRPFLRSSYHAKQQHFRFSFI